MSRGNRAYRTSEETAFVEFKLNAVRITDFTVPSDCIFLAISIIQSINSLKVKRPKGATFIAVAGVRLCPRHCSDTHEPTS